MAIQSIQQLHATLSADMKKLGSQGVVNHMERKTFSARINGTVYEFGHKQGDPAFWSGVKHYGSGPSSRLRLPRTPAAPEAEVVVKPKARRKARAAEVPAPVA